MGEQVARVAVEVAGVGHHVLAVARPALDHRAGLQRTRAAATCIGWNARAAAGGRARPRGASARGSPTCYIRAGTSGLLGGPVRRDRHHAKKPRWSFSSGARHVGVGDRDAARIFGHLDHSKLAFGKLTMSCALAKAIASVERLRARTASPDRAAARRRRRSRARPRSPPAAARASGWPAPAARRRGPSSCPPRLHTSWCAGRLMLRFGARADFLRGRAAS